jgi:hypothetical protein
MLFWERLVGLLSEVEVLTLEEVELAEELLEVVILLVEVVLEVLLLLSFVFRTIVLSSLLKPTLSSLVSKPVLLSTVFKPTLLSSLVSKLVLVSLVSEITVVLALKLTVSLLVESLIVDSLVPLAKLKLQAKKTTRENNKAILNIYFDFEKPLIITTSLFHLLNLHLTDLCPQKIVKYTLNLLKRLL